MKQNINISEMNVRIYAYSILKILNLSLNTQVMWKISTKILENTMQKRDEKY